MTMHLQIGEPRTQFTGLLVISVMSAMLTHNISIKWLNPAPCIMHTQFLKLIKLLYVLDFAILIFICHIIT